MGTEWSRRNTGCFEHGRWEMMDLLVAIRCHQIDAESLKNTVHGSPKTCGGILDVARVLILSI